MSDAQVENQFKPGVSGNPVGRPKGSKNKFSLADLQKSLDKAKESHKGVSLLDHVCDKAYADNALAIAILKKMLPDLKQVAAVMDVEIGGFVAMTPAQAAEFMDLATKGNKPDAE